VVDLVSLAYGIVATIAILIIMKIFDMILEHFLDKTVFSRIWTATTQALKKFQTRFNPIVMCFKFRVKFEPSEPTRVKNDLMTLVESLAEKHKGQLTFSPLTWTDDDRIGSVKVTFNEREYGIDMHISSEFKEFEPEQEIFEEAKASETEVSESVAFSIEVHFPFKSIEPMLLSLTSLTNFLSQELKESFPIVGFSKGLFTIAPIKGDFTMDHWIKEKKFDVSLLLKAQENITVNLYPKIAEIVFPTLQIDEKVSEYLKATILNYYL
jgi:hypothetical protein